MKLFQFFQENGESKLILAKDFETAKKFIGEYDKVRYIGKITTNITKTKEVKL